MEVDDTFDWDEWYWGHDDVPWIEFREQIINVYLSFTGAESLKYFFDGYVRYVWPLRKLDQVGFK